MGIFSKLFGKKPKRPLGEPLFGKNTYALTDEEIADIEQTLAPLDAPATTANPEPLHFHFYATDKNLVPNQILIGLTKAEENLDLIDYNPITDDVTIPVRLDRTDGQVIGYLFPKDRDEYRKIAKFVGLAFVAGTYLYKGRMIGEILVVPSYDDDGQYVLKDVLIGYAKRLASRVLYVSDNGMD